MDTDEVVGSLLAQAAVGADGPLLIDVDASIRAGRRRQRGYRALTVCAVLVPVAVAIPLLSLPSRGASTDSRVTAGSSDAVAGLQTAYLPAAPTGTSSVASLEAQELTSLGATSAVPPASAFEVGLLARGPVTSAVYDQSLAAMVDCASRTLPGLAVTLAPDRELPYMKGLLANYTGPASALTTGDREPTVVLGDCVARYSAAVEAHWELQHLAAGQQ